MVSGILGTYLENSEDETRVAMYSWAGCVLPNFKRRCAHHEHFTFAYLLAVKYLWGRGTIV